MPSDMSTAGSDQQLGRVVEELKRDLERKTRELAEAREQQAATAEILTAISDSPTDPYRVFADIAASAARLCDAYDATIRQVDGGQLRLVAHYGPILTGPTVPLMHGAVAGRAVLDRRTIHLADEQSEMDEYPEGSEFARRLSYRTILCVPLLRAAEAIGVITIRRAEVRPFTDREVDLLKTFGDQAVIAIENTRLFEAEQTRTWELQASLEYQTATSDVLNVIGRSPTDVRPVFDVIAKSAAQLCAAQFCHVFRFDGELIHFAASYGLPAEAIALIRRGYPMLPGKASISGRTILSGAVEEIADVDSDAAYGRAPTARAIGYRGIVAVPMLRSAQPIGAIVVGRAEPGRFLARQIELLKTFADQAVIAIENARLFEEVQAKTGELTEALEQQTATSEVLKVISSSPGELEPCSRPYWRTRYASATPSSVHYSGTTASYCTERPESARRPRWSNFRSSVGRFCRHRQAGSMRRCGQRKSTTSSTLRRMPFPA
jgi:two-component system, NtrC family, sensor kinase